MMIEAVPAPVLSGRALRRFAQFCEAVEPAGPAPIGRGDLQFFVGAYLGALVFFLAWLG